MHYFSLLLGALLMLVSCGKPDSAQREETYGNPPAQGFRADDSDPRALALADSVMQAMGGRKAWDDTRYLGWNFFGMRRLIWDKTGKRVRIHSFPDSTVYLLDLEDVSGQVFRNGRAVRAPGLLDSLLRRGKSIWINDSYWLVMPFKLKDSGVALHYLGRDTMPGGGPAELIALDFEDVGDTPQNKYHVYIHPETHLVGAWSYFRQAADSLPVLTTPWKDYRSYGNILLSGDRGQRQLEDIRVWESLPDSVFTRPHAWKGY